MIAHAYSYVGEELELFERAVRWKRYLGSCVRQYLIGDVLEVGAGIGGTTRVLCDGRQASWTALEPDATLAARLSRSAEARPFPVPVSVHVATLGDLDAHRRFDVILYVDVLEHIEADADELDAAARALAPGGRLVVLSPAHPRLFSAFDRAVGHYRRYTASSLAALTPDGLTLERTRYLDAAGLLASLGNRLVLRQPLPTQAQIDAWDRMLVPASRWLDPLLGHRVGRSVLAVWRHR